MKIVATTLLAAGAALFAYSGTAEARDYNYGSRYSSGYGGYASGHGRTHDALNHNEFHRQSSHAAAHRYPMTYGQHGGLHQQLNHDRYHDGLRHERSHRPAPSYGRSYYGGLGVYSPW